ncbi:NAD dependent epimerase/dehydratase family protein [Candida parapsilosis]|uniref:NAD dependent epimerase/dehydratase family protein n=1 Tax=Candida parapsilosis TaxID=5480 RepID=A0A8X7NM40_CANPA|nr:NAD dependent epimerase/dehydratase family protein [Candida parapsilosis]KAF6051307.1 NAD dependent epimerase/dehydratase family protein [Candida parapsilosis]
MSTDSSKPQTVIITGGTGYVGQHIVGQLLHHNYNVIIIDISPTRAMEIVQLFNHPNLQCKVVDQLNKPNSIDFVLRQFPHASTFIASAAVVPRDDIEDYEAEIIQMNRDILKNTLDSIKHCGGCIQRVVVTSSTAAYVSPEKAFAVDAVYSDDDWNPLPYEAGKQSVSAAYFVSKRINEELVWQFVKDETPQFDLVTVAPAFCIGPSFFSSQVSLTNLPSSTSTVGDLLKLHKSDTVPYLGAGAVDVRDVAKAHVAVINNPKASNQRLVVEAYKFTNANAINVLKANFPELKDKLPDVEPIPESKFVEPNLKKSREILGIEKYYSLTESVVDLAKQLLKE